MLEAEEYRETVQVLGGLLGLDPAEILERLGNRSPSASRVRAAPCGRVRLPSA